MRMIKMKEEKYMTLPNIQDDRMIHEFNKIREETCKINNHLKLVNKTPAINPKPHLNKIPKTVKSLNPNLNLKKIILNFKKLKNNSYNKNKNNMNVDKR